MKPLFITISTATAEQICRFLETLEIVHDSDDAGVLAAEIRGMIAADVEPEEPAPTPEELDPVDPELEIPEEADLEAPEPDDNYADEPPSQGWASQKTGPGTVGFDGLD